MPKAADQSKSYNITDFLLSIATKISFCTLIKAFFCVNIFLPIFPGEVLYFLGGIFQVMKKDIFVTHRDDF